MKKYTIEISETLQKQVTVKANSREEAIQKVKEQYHDCDIILDSNYYIDSEFQYIKEEKIKKGMER